MIKKESPYIVTLSGIKFHFLEPKDNEISIVDIAHSLANICRFTGHTSEHYSVAQHCVILSMIIFPDFAKLALLHDAQETYVNDISSPLKKIICGKYKKFHNNIQHLIYKKFGIDNTHTEEMERLDDVLCAIEMHTLLPIMHDDSLKKYKGYIDYIKIKPVPAGVAEINFLERFYELFGR